MMSNELKYKNICLATDLSQYAYSIAKKAISLPLAYEHFLVLHVIEPPVMYTQAFAELNQLVSTLKSEAENSLNYYLHSLALPPEAGYIEMGPSKNAIIDFIKKNQIDLLILGSHGIGGFSHLIGSTASYVVSNAPCDVWMIHVMPQPSLSASPNISEPSPSMTAPSDRFGIKQHPIFSGSEKGVKQDTTRGPHLTIRPKGAPTKGQTRDDEGNNNQDNS